AVTVNAGGAVGQGARTGILNSSGTGRFLSGWTFLAEVKGTVPGTLHDQLDVTGMVSLSGATLSTLGSTITSSPGQRIVLINNDSTDAVTGTFSGLAEGDPVVVNGVKFFVSYQGGDG